jgi:formylmethanofuran dehydrogenase subunit E
MKTLGELLALCSAHHRRLCPRQVLGVRMGILAGEIFGLDLPQTDKRLLSIVETDGCASDGIAVATNCWVGRRTMRVEDYGKVAATFVDTQTERAVRIVPRRGCRDRARTYAPEAGGKWEAYLLGYQRMSTEELLLAQVVQLKTPISQLISRTSVKAICDVCGEEITNEREVKRDTVTLCRSCAGESYYLLRTDVFCTVYSVSGRP